MRFSDRLHAYLTRGLGLFLILLVAVAKPASAHVGNPNVFWQGKAGPYDISVTVRMPQVIPGVAQIDIRSESDAVREVDVFVTRVTGPGTKYSPLPEKCTVSAADTRLFSSSLWIMEFGSLAVQLAIAGSLGPAHVSVPIAASAPGPLRMGFGLALAMSSLTLLLGFGFVLIIRAAARESTLAGSVTPGQRDLRRARIGTALATLTLGVWIAGTLSWWKTEADAYATKTRIYAPIGLKLKLDGSHLSIESDSNLWNGQVGFDRLIPDHGHDMHLFIVRDPTLDRFYHLHPLKASDQTMAIDLPAMEAGNYRVFADVVDSSGFPWTLIGRISIPAGSGVVLRGDDSEASAAPISTGRSTMDSELPDGGRMLWLDGPATLRSGRASVFHFRVEDRPGHPAEDLEPYMQMVAHAVFLRSDGSVFSHIHPNGSVPMASLMLSARESPGEGSIPICDMPNHSSMSEGKLSPDIDLPYGFPKPGEYRIFVQIKRSGKVETGVFDADVE